MIHGKDIICISSIDWDFIWQGHQEIMSSLARQGNRVLFIENTGVRAPNLKDLPRLNQRLRNWLHSTKGFRQVKENLFVYSPIILPFPYSRVARWINRSLLLRALARWMRAIGFRPSIVWTFLPTELARDLLRALEPELTVYYCIDDFAASSAAARRIRKSEHKLFKEVDLVFVTAEHLRQRAAKFSKHVHVFPFAVDFERFEKARKDPDGVAAELAALPRPIIGYVGGVHRWIDLEMMERAVVEFREASFVFVGPAQTDVSALAKHPNVHFLGARSHEQVPQYIKGFDVGIVPYQLSEYTKNVYPTKLNEYLAMGIPVVATDLPEIRRFNLENKGIVQVSERRDGFASAIRKVVGTRSPEAVNRRIAVARQNSWNNRIEQMSQLLKEALEVRQKEGASWDQKLNRMYHTARRRVLSTLTAAVLTYLAIFHSPLIWWVAEPLRMVEPPRSADVIVVFAGGVGESGKAGGGYQERVKQAVDLYEAGFAPRMVFSSGYTFVFDETEIMRELAVAQGVPVSDILLETKATNTFENVILVEGILQSQGWRSVLLVSSPYHMRRAVWTWRKAAPELEVIPVPVPRSQYYQRGWGASLEQIRGILHEYAGIFWYWWKGWI